MKLKTNQDNEKYRQLAVDLSIVIGTQFSATEAIYAQDTFIFRKLVENDKKEIDEIRQSINWYAKNQGCKYVPVIDSAQELREKYHKLIRAKNRKDDTAQFIPKDSLGDNATHLSLNLSTEDDIEEWKKRYANLADKLANEDIWAYSYTPDKDRIIQALISLKEWVNNANWRDYPYITAKESSVKMIVDDFDADPIVGQTYFIGNCSKGRVIGTLPILLKEYISWIDDQMQDAGNGERGWLYKGIKENILFPSHKMFSLFIEQLTMDISPYPGAFEIKSRGWGVWIDKKRETLDERYKREKQEEKEQKKIKRQEEADKEIKKQNVIWVLNTMKLNLSDLGKSNIDILNIEKWISRKDDNWKQEFSTFLAKVEKKHLENSGNRSHSYYYLFKKI